MNRPQLVATADRMVAHLRRINERDPGTRAMLRRGLGRPPEDIANFHAHAVVTRYLPERCDHATERAFYTVAALVAAQPRGARDQEAAEATSAESTDEATAENAAAESTPEPAAPEDTAEGTRRTFGQTLAWAVENGHLKGDMVRERLHLLARYRTDRLHRELPKLVAHLRADLVPIDWGYLLRDLALWDEERDQVAKRWVQQYHRTRDQIQRQRATNGEPATPNNRESEPA
ncbi:type I-E CRISPR-associated protein Cse2/CasB [Halostreptopolyspora alba]|uniref:Type I-E CRISPR-associated protein Cse2/CasB n=1 Tax=Halostreptopolyspora alba TaxID=2487137 RepID=A0A3N0EG00_9ACTN|nr:type I-E CRISPR-associated protein Cse2/CasB [Nocardiopsaceae bacterium YIM 96095]